MAARHVFAFSFSIAVAASVALPPGFARAEDAVNEPLPQVDNAKFQFMGKVNMNAIPVRSGPNNSFYATTKLDKGATVKVVGIKGEWLKITPPEGSFSLVPQAYVNRRGDGKVGRVHTELNVRAGSTLNAMKSTIQLQMSEGQDVTILDVQDEYFKIAPPEGAYLYVNKQYVDPIDKVGGAKSADPAEKPVEVAEKKEPAKPTGETPTDKVALSQTPTEKVAEAPSSQPDTKVAEAPAVPTSNPSVAIADEFRAAEADFEALGKASMIDQDVAPLTARYGKLAASGSLTGSAKRIVEARLTALKMRADAREQLVAFRQSQTEMKQRQQSLQSEKQEIDERLKQTQVSLYTAVGMLRVSSIQRGQVPLYRLTDPASGRTVVYIRSNDTKYASLLNQFVGVRGDLTTDERLKMKIIAPTEAEPVDASKVNSTVIATITPASMLPPSAVSAVSADAADAGH